MANSQIGYNRLKARFEICTAMDFFYSEERGVWSKNSRLQRDNVLLTAIFCSNIMEEKTNITNIPLIEGAIQVETHKFNNKSRSEQSVQL